MARTASNSFLALLAVAASAMAIGVDNVDLVNSSTACDWLNAEELVGDVITQKLNATDVVAQCTSVCQLAFAGRSPDIAGKGVFISLFIQASLSSLFGIVLPIFIWIITLGSWRTLTRAIPFIRSLQLSIYKISSFFSLALAISSLILNNQHPSIMATTYLTQISTLQLMLLLSMIWGLHADYQMTCLRDSSVSFAWGVYYALCGVVQIIVSYVIGLPPATVTVYKDLAKSCQTEHRLPHFSGYVGSTSNQDSSIKYLAIGVAIGAGISILGCILAIPMTKLCKWMAEYMGAWLRKHGVWIGFSILLLFYASVVVLDAIVIADFRETWRRISGDAWGNEGEWGFGQSTALLIWAPFVWTVVRSSYRLWKDPPPTTKTVEDDDEMEELDLEATRTKVEEAVLPPYSSKEVLQERINHAWRAV